MMNLDKRQRAMLGEMGVRVWQPMPEPAAQAAPTQPAGPATAVAPASPTIEPQIAIYSGAIIPRFDWPAAPLTATERAPKPVEKAAPPAVQPDDSASNFAWRAGPLQPLYADIPPQNSNRWLILLEAPANSRSASFNALDGDAGKLLDNMLRAAQLHLAGAVLLAPLARSETGSGLPHAVTDLLASAQADVVLVMGRLAAQALLQSTDPLAKLRGHVHVMQGQQIVITLDPAYLLRNPLEKSKAWDDLCLAMSRMNAPISAPVIAAGQVSAP